MEETPKPTQSPEGPPGWPDVVLAVLCALATVGVVAFLVTKGREYSVIYGEFGISLPMPTAYLLDFSYDWLGPCIAIAIVYGLLLAVVFMMKNKAARRVTLVGFLLGVGLIGVLGYAALELPLQKMRQELR